MAGPSAPCAGRAGLPPQRVLSPGLSAPPGHSASAQPIPRVCAGQALPFAPVVRSVSGLLAAACARLCLVAFLPSDRRVIWRHTEPQQRVLRREPAGMTKQFRTLAGRVAAGRRGRGGYWAHRQSRACQRETAQPRRRERTLSHLCPPRDGPSGSKKNEGLSGAAVFY